MPKERLQSEEIIDGAIRLLSITLCILLRRQFGVRTSGDIFKACIFSWLVLSAYSGIANAFPTLPRSPLSRGFLYLLSARGMFHVLGSRLRRNYTEIHSRSMGRPWKIWSRLPLSDVTICRYAQPLSSLLLSGLIGMVDEPLAYWIGACAVSLFIKEQESRRKLRTRVLDAIDSRIESKTLNDNIQVRLNPRRAAMGDQRVESSEVRQAERPASRKSLGSRERWQELDPELQKMLKQDDPA